MSDSLVDRKQRLRVGRWVVTLMFNGPYRSGVRKHGPGHYSAAVPWVCGYALRKASR